MRILVILFTLLLFENCSSNKVLIAKSPGKFYDDHFVLKKHRYKKYGRLIFNIGMERGRYILSHDTVYLFHKEKGTLYLDGFGILNADTSSIVIYKQDKAESDVYGIYYRKI